MSPLTLFHFCAVLASIALGLMVLRTNPRRATNQIFALLSADLGLWLVCMALAFISPSFFWATLFIRGCHSFGATFPLLFDSLRISIINPGKSFGYVFRQNPLLLATTLLIAAASQTPWIVESAYIPAGTNMIMRIPEPILGRFYGSFLIFYAATLGLLVWRFWVSLSGSAGIQRTELHFTLLGAAGSIITGVTLAIIPPIITGSAQSAQFTSLGVIVLDSIIAFGIATRRIMDMAYLFRLLTAYSLLTLYLGALYLAIWWPLHVAMRMLNHPGTLFPGLAASVAVAFSLAPVHGFMQRFANRLFAQTAPLNMGSVVQLTSRLLYSISTIEKLLADFSETTAQILGTDKVCVLLAENGSYLQRYPADKETAPVSLDKTSTLPLALRKHGEVIVPDVLHRLNPDPALAAACKTIEDLHFAAAIGLHSKEGLEGIFLLGPKLTGRIYGAPEQNALQLLCNHLAVALNNARLYTQIQDSKIYNDILVDNLVNGVVAANQDGLITVFNREAQRITRLPQGQALLHPVSTLPPALAHLLTTTLSRGQGIRDHEISLPLEHGEPIPIRVSSSVFYGHTGKILGAFLVITDLTTVRKLELQVRRTDRLASLGTLAAVMAHEIKNPLVSIKTFTQLLPERYEDADFRDTFSSLVGGEVKRIDSIVNQLLRFSRPSKPVLSPTSLHEVLNNALKLIKQQLRTKNIQLAVSFISPTDRINADGDQLSQALINFLLNAVESMPEGGALTVTTTPSPQHEEGGPLPGRAIRVSIQDTGVGIAPENIPHIFDPFFTTKSQGTGLGLSVAHGIIQEHNGTIEIQSEVGQGTTFILSFPLIEEASRT